MLRIAICDDDSAVCSKMEKIILSFNKKIKCEMEIDIFLNGEDLIYYLENKKNFDLIFLCIELDGLTGVDIGKRIRNKLDNHISKIVFMSSESGYEEELFEIQPLNFLRKPIDNNKLMECITLAVKILDKEFKFFEYKVGHDIKRVQLDNIVYFESNLKKIKIVTINEEDHFYSSLEKVKAKLTGMFVSPHGSFLINYSHIEKITSRKIYMTNGNIIPASRRNIKNIYELQNRISGEIENL